jgi:hypothetical protein
MEEEKQQTEEVNEAPGALRAFAGKAWDTVRGGVGALTGAPPEGVDKEDISRVRMIVERAVISVVMTFVGIGTARSAVSSFYQPDKTEVSAMAEDFGTSMKAIQSQEDAKETDVQKTGAELKTEFYDRFDAVLESAAAVYSDKPGQVVRIMTTALDKGLFLMEGDEGFFGYAFLNKDFDQSKPYDEAGMDKVLDLTEAREVLRDAYLKIPEAERPTREEFLEHAWEKGFEMLDEKKAEWGENLGGKMLLQLIPKNETLQEIGREEIDYLLDMTFPEMKQEKQQEQTQEISAEALERYDAAKASGEKQNLGTFTQHATEQDGPQKTTGCEGR